VQNYVTTHFDGCSAKRSQIVAEGFHLDVIGHDQAVKSDIHPDDVHDCFEQCRRRLVNIGVNLVRRHLHWEIIKRLKGQKILDIQAIAWRVNFGQVKMAVSGRATMSRDMLNDRQNAAI
jgi:hypothetical protein